MQRLFKIFNPDIEPGVRLISIATSVRWFGWGFAEAFLPVFLFSFVHTYAETGLLRSVYGIIFLFVLPIVSWFADRVPSKKLMIAALLLYPFISLSYFSAGAWGIVVFVICARLTNGVAYALDSIGRSTYVRTHARGSSIATSFGFIDSLANFWWLIAVFASVFLVRYIPVHYLFLAIIPTSLIAILFVLKLPNGLTSTGLDKETKFSLTGSYGGFLKTIVSWGSRVRWLAVLSFFVSVVALVGEFFMPIYAFTQNESLWRVMLLTGFATLPSLLSSPLGIIADKYRRTIFWTCGISALFLFALAFLSSFPAQLILVFLIGVSLQLLSLAVDREVTFQVPRDQIGSLSGAFQGIGQASEIIGPIVLGIMIDLVSMQTTIIMLGACSLVFMGMYRNFNRK